MKLFSSLAIIFLLPSLVFAHGGSVDAKGGHTNKKTGEYHCHKKACYSMPKRPMINTSRAPKYNRDEWKHWSDLDFDCMNTRHEILKDQADKTKPETIKLSPDGCYISMATWHDPFSGKTYTRASDLDVDHIIPLKWAHDHGGYSWDRVKKEEFANDPINLLAVDDGLNQSKGAQGPTEWMPPNHAFRCEYLSKWQRVLKKYKALKMTPGEKRIFGRQLRACQEPRK